MSEQLSFGKEIYCAVFLCKQNPRQLMDPTRRLLGGMVRRIATPIASRRIAEAIVGRSIQSYEGTAHGLTLCGSAIAWRRLPQGTRTVLP
jgi:hypothetical protein